MANFTKQECKLFTKYWGVRDLARNEEFWEDAFREYQEQNIPIPLMHTPIAARYVLGKLNCVRCASCCHYDKVPITKEDIERIAKGKQTTTDEIMKFISTDEGNLYIKSTGGCPFLEDKCCTIYAYRPDTCYFYPLQNAKDAFDDNGKSISQMVIRLECRASLELIKTLLTEATNTGEFMLLPDLTIIRGR